MQESVYVTQPYQTLHKMDVRRSLSLQLTEFKTRNQLQRKETIFKAQA